MGTPPGYGAALAQIWSKLKGGAASPSPQPGGPPPPPPPGGLAPHPNALTPAQVHEQKKNDFLKAAASDFSSGNIGPDDLKKAVTAANNAPDYEAWKQENVQHIKASNEGK